ncbi:probable E3 ubiquitin-protein ligase HERC4 isoform X2 [Ornithodoros turicata]|uniref:probable E3 ubiquitin-protein ligase HERC4 isoform X2 n=1 Tax=Ornithodoros turicata TaxID=34597 RepID=UPI00313966F3
MKRGHAEATTPTGSGNATPTNGCPMVIFGWGHGPSGELGLGGISGETDEDIVAVPRQLRRFGSRVVKDVACGKQHTLVLLANGYVYSCGSNEFGQLGQDRSQRKLEQVSALAAHEIRAVSCGQDHSLALSEAGQVFSWGCNKDGQLGNDSTDPQHNKPKVIKKLAVMQVVQIASGALHSLALTINGELYAWGSNSNGQLGIGEKDGGRSSHRSPCRVTHLAGIPLTQVACGGYHSVALTLSGALFVWGLNSFGQLGTNDKNDRFVPTVLKSLRSQRIKHVCCGENHTACLTSDGGVFTFGCGTYGQLGHGAKANETVPKRISELMGTIITQLACGRCHTLAYAPRAGRLYSFGLGGAGQLGQGSSAAGTTLLPGIVQGPWTGVVHQALQDRSPSPQPVQSNRSKEESKVFLHKVVCGGDRNFVLCYEDKGDSPPRPLDFRFHCKDTQISSMDNDVLEQLPFFPVQEQVPQELLSYLETIFGSTACLNASYLKEDDAHYNCSDINHGMDLEAARHGFKCIEDAKNPSIPELVGLCLEELVKLLPTAPLDIEGMRVFLLLPMCHLFKNPQRYLASLVGKYCHSVAQLSTRAQTILSKWWSLLAEAQFEDLISVFKGCIIFVLQQDLPTKQNHGHLKLALDVLAKLSTVNREYGGIVPYEHFYIPAVTEKVDVQLDYIQWVQSSRTQRNNKVYFCDYPFVFNAQAKTIILQTDSHIQMQQAMETACQQTFASLILPVVPPSNPYLVLYVGRQNIVNDTLNQLADQSAADLKKPLKVQFHGEEAVDAGGVRKEFFLLLLKEILDPKYGMFTEYPESRCIWFNTQSFEEDAMLYYLIGIVCGLAIYNFTIIALPFPLALYKKLLKQQTKLVDLRGLSPTLAKSLQDLLDYQGDDIENTFFLTFEVTVDHYGTMRNYELKEGGRNIKVTKENRQEYVNLYVDFILNTSVHRSFSAFAEGFYKVCTSKVLDLFHAQELMILVVGSENYDWNELEKNAQYKNEFHRNHPTVRTFWRVFHGLDYEEKKKFLLFLTGSDRIPIMGMSEIKLVIQPMKVGDDHLPVAHTCFNLLDLPMYSNEEVMERKIRQAIQHTEGFGLV